MTPSGKLQNESPVPPPRAVAWETTRRCPMSCRHCRAGAESRDYDGELSFEEGLRLIDALASSFGKPLLILTGGEPMSRPDIYELAKAANAKGLPTVMAPCGKLLDRAAARKLKEAGVKAVSLSVDGPDAASHDEFRGCAGAFDYATSAIKAAIAEGLQVQVNAAVSKLNAGRLAEIHDLARELGASTIDFFLLVPTGRGAALKGLELRAEESERVYNWIYELSLASPLSVKCTCAPAYARVQAARAKAEGRELPPGSKARGCLAGSGFLFVSHDGAVQPCGFLKADCGNVRDTGFDLPGLWRGSETLRKLRDKGSYGGACGRCAFSNSCGGCRARAYEATGDLLAEEPSCVLSSGRACR